MTIIGVAEMTSIRELQIWIAEHVEARLSVDAFVRLLGITPRRYRELAGHSIPD